MEDKSRQKWNYTFQWTENHLSPEEINPLRYEYDVLGAAALERLQEISKSANGEKERGGERKRLDLYALLRENHGKDEVLRRFWDELHDVPSWVDWEQIERGQRFFYRYAAANLTGFALQGFVGENSVSADLSTSILQQSSAEDGDRQLPAWSRSSCVQEASPLGYSSTA